MSTNTSNGFFLTMQELIKNGKCWTDKTFIVRERLMFCKLLTDNELFNHCDQQWSVYDRLLSCQTWQELQIMFVSYQASMSFQVADWIVLLYGFGIAHVNAENGVQYTFNPEVVYKGIEESAFFDEALKNTRILDMIFKQGATKNSLPEHRFAYQIVYFQNVAARLFKKFPQLAKHSSNMVRTKSECRYRINPSKIDKTIARFKNFYVCTTSGIQNA